MISIAILGFGVVGSGVAEVLTINSDKITQSTSTEISLKYILDIRDFPGNPFEEKLTKDFTVIENDPEVKIVVETIGGTGIAYEFTRRAILAGKSVVTSNKELVATRGMELLQLAADNNVSYMFEASVGGGIPIIRPIKQCLSADKIKEIYGILNGTTNYILTEMIKNGKSFEDALKKAQEFGYAESNPAADIDGDDACRKICILSSLCFGKHIYPKYVKTRGIRHIDEIDIHLAESIGCKIKLLGRGIINPDGKISAYVAPHLIYEDNLLANVEGVMNGIVVKGNAIGSVMFYGPGAGKLPTASAVAADVVDSVNMISLPKHMPWTEDVKENMLDDSKNLCSKWYIRTSEKFDNIKKIAELNNEIAYITDEMSENELLSKINADKIKAYYRILV